MEFATFDFKNGVRASLGENAQRQRALAILAASVLRPGGKNRGHAEPS